MLKITQVAQEKISEAINRYTQPVDGLRVLARRVSPFHIEYGLAFVPKNGGKDNDHVTKYDKFNVYIDKEIEDLLDETSLNFEDGPMGSGFKFENDAAFPEEYKGTLAEKVVPVIENQINPQVAGHGGSIRLIDVKDTKVYVELGGGCQGCGMAKQTLKNGIEVMLKEAIPEVTEVIDVTDHSSGDNPYYK